MPTAIRSSAPIFSASSKSDYNQLMSIALFSGIGLLVALVAVIYGAQGAWY